MLREISMLCHSHYIYMWFSDLQFGGVFDLEQFPYKVQKLVDRLKRSDLDDRIN